VTSSVDYDKAAAEYDRRYRVASFPGMENALLELVAGCPGGRVLEVGCGTGHWLEFLAGRGFAVAGVDASAGMLQLARSRVSRALLAEGRAECLPWRRERFHRVICINAVHHFGDRRGFVCAAGEVLLPGGGLSVIGLNPHTGLDRWCVYEYFSPALENDLKRYPPRGRSRR
jgi:ubiquinone/menaquinone biosynthesis C-methylase UbiE